MKRALSFFQGPRTWLALCLLGTAFGVPLHLSASAHEARLSITAADAQALRRQHLRHTGRWPTHDEERLLVRDLLRQRVSADLHLDRLGRVKVPPPTEPELRARYLRDFQPRWLPSETQILDELTDEITAAEPLPPPPFEAVKARLRQELLSERAAAKRTELADEALRTYRIDGVDATGLPTFTP